MPLSRRYFLQSSLAGSLASATSLSAADSDRHTILLLGDLHYDRLEHHDWNWLQRHHPRDESQIRNYSRLTTEVMPALFTVVRERVAALRTSDTLPAFTIQLGDLVEGLCGSEERAVQQNREAVEFVSQELPDLPFLFTKGNHDVTGEGANAAFDEVLQTFQQQQSTLIDHSSHSSGANYTLTHGPAQYVFFDAYDRGSLAWLEAVAEKRTAPHLFVVVHPPIVPYGARATWHLYSGQKSAPQRAKLLDLLAEQETIVLSGHLHKFSALTRRVGRGRFTQLAVSSIVNDLQAAPRDVLQGVDQYTGDQVTLEPRHAPDTVELRRSIYDRERRQVSSFEYANTAGYAVLTVDPSRVEAAIYAGSSREPFRSIRVTSG